METYSEKTGYVLSSTNMASNYASRGWGTYIRNAKVTSYKVGDIVSMSGHVWICLGQCSDGSILLIHSTPNAGVQISGTVSSNGVANSQAYQIASEYMKTYFPYWSKYYSAKSCGNSYFKGNVMRWNLTSGVLRDPDGISNMSPEEVLQSILGNRPRTKAYIDVPESTWYIDALNFVLDNGIMSGTGAGEFSPNMIVTRSQMAQVLYNYSDNKSVDKVSAEFLDVEDSAWYATAIRWAASNGVA